MIKPLFDNIVLEPIEAEIKTSSGIIIPDSAQEKPQRAKVYAVGKDSQLKVGDTVLYKKWGGSEVKIDNKEYLIVEERDILAIL